MMNNETNLLKYKRLAPFYDALMGNALIRQARQKAFRLLPMRPEQDILLIGVGTGEDLPFLPTDAQVTGIDLSDDMLARARQKIHSPATRLLNMNAEHLDFPDHSFDTVVLNLILSVVENPRQAMDEALRVLKPNGTLLIFDKFLNEHATRSPLRNLLNLLTSAIGTDINRKLSDILAGKPVTITHDQPVLLNGAYRAIVIIKGDRAYAGDRTKKSTRN